MQRQVAVFFWGGAAMQVAKARGNGAARWCFMPAGYETDRCEFPLPLL